MYVPKVANLLAQLGDALLRARKLDSFAPVAKRAFVCQLVFLPDVLLERRAFELVAVLQQLHAMLSLRDIENSGVNAFALPYKGLRLAAQLADFR